VGHTVRELLSQRELRIAEYHCSSGPEDVPFEEQFRATSVAFVRGGSFAIRSPRGAAALGPGSLVLGNAREPYTCSHEGRGDLCLSFRYSERLLDEVAGGATFRRPALPAGPLMALPAVVDAAVSGKGPSLEEVAIEVLGRALEADATRTLRPEAPRAADERRAQEAMRFIDAHAGEPLTLRGLAGRARLSAYHFLRSFRAAAGTTPHQYLLGARLRRAAALLLGSDLPVTGIAYEAGFGDLSNFIRTFRRATGRSPRAFREARGL
jgi:AraC-like DNA-binding protein